MPNTCILQYPAQQDGVGALILALNAAMVGALLWLLVRPHTGAIAKVAARAAECAARWGCWGRRRAMTLPRSQRIGGLTEAGGQQSP